MSNSHCVEMGREIAGILDVAETREWLVTNGIGGYASGTIAGSISRGYHGLLVAAVHPPVDRRVMLVKLDECVSYQDKQFDLTSNRWSSGSVAPAGYVNIQQFVLEGSIPRWRFACADAVLEKRVWMEHGANTTYIAYTLVSARSAIRLQLSAIADNRVYHNTGMTDRPKSIQALANGVRVIPSDSSARPLTLLIQGGQVSVADDVYRGFYLAAEQARGLRNNDDHVHVASFEASLNPGSTLLFVASAEDNPALDDNALTRRRQRDQQLLDRWRKARPASAPTPAPWLAQLALAADQFVVDRPSSDQSDGKSVIAGYHWFGDWGRDTMISLRGLTLITGRAEIAAPILTTFARYISQGMLPNRFPDAGETPEYNTIDATLWYFQALRDYLKATKDLALLRELYPKLEDIIAWHLRGTRYAIQVDSSDGLLCGGQAGVQLTWMDAKVGDWVVTPRIGKPVEVNALWYNALRCMEDFAQQLGEPGAAYQQHAEAAANGFQRFWNTDAGYCYDVLDGPQGNDASLRPNQLLAIALPECPLTPEQQRAVLDSCSGNLLTSHGLRSLARSAPGYQGFYGGDQSHRDGAYHQGTVWAWLIGPYLNAHLRVYQDPAAARRLLDSFADHLRGAGLGSVSEIFDGDAPFTPRGCIAQAWSVAEILQADDAINRFEQNIL